MKAEHNFIKRVLSNHVSNFNKDIYGSELDHGYWKYIPAKRLSLHRCNASAHTLGSREMKYQQNITLIAIIFSLCLFFPKHFVFLQENWTVLCSSVGLITAKTTDFISGSGSE